MKPSNIQPKHLLDKLPKGWKADSFSNLITDISAGRKSIKREDYLSKGDYPIVDQGNTLIGGYSNEKAGVIKIESPIIIFGDHTRGFKYIDFDFIPGADGTKILKAGKELIPKYAYYFFKTLKIPNTGYNRHYKYLKEIVIPYPDLSTQEIIVDRLDRCIDIETKRQETLTKLESLIQSVFLNMFGDPIRNQKNWEIKKLGDISSKILSGNTPKGGNKVYVENGILFLRSQNVWRNNLVLDDVAYITEETHGKMKNSSLKYKDLLMTKTGRINTENSSLGRAAIYSGEDDRANINGHVYLIRLKPGILHEFVLYILTTREFRDYIRSVCVGGIDKRQINKIHLENFPIIQPPVDLQNKFVQILQSANSQEKLMNASLLNIEKLNQSVVHKVFNESLTE